MLISSFINWLNWEHLHYPIVIYCWGNYRTIRFPMLIFVQMLTWYDSTQQSTLMTFIPPLIHWLAPWISSPLPFVFIIKSLQIQYADNIITIYANGIYHKNINIGCKSFLTIKIAPWSNVCSAASSMEDPLLINSFEILTCEIVQFFWGGSTNRYNSHA